MKRFLLLVIAAAIFTGCEKPDILKSDAEKATPTPAPTPQPTPKRGEWMFKDYKNPLDGGTRGGGGSKGGRPR